MGNIKHAFVSGKADGGDASLVRPSNWNAAHEGAVEILDRDLTQIDVANDAVETSIYSFSIPAGALGATGGFRLTLGGDMLKNVAGTIIWRVKLGATTVLVSDASAPFISVDRHKWTLVILCLNSAVAAQKWNLRGQTVTNTASLAVHILSSGNISTLLDGYNVSTEDTSGALVLEVTIEWSAASASLSYRKEMALLELIPAA